MTNETLEKINNLKKITKGAGSSFLLKGFFLSEIKETFKNEDLEDYGYTSFQAFLEDEDIKISKSVASQAINAYKFYIEEMGLNYSDVDGYLPQTLINIRLDNRKKIKNGTFDMSEARQAILDHSVLGKSDQIKELQEKKLIKKRPHIYFDDDTEKYVVEFMPEQVHRIINLETKEIIYDNV